MAPARGDIWGALELGPIGVTLGEGHRENLAIASMFLSQFHLCDVKAKGRCFATAAPFPGFKNLRNEMTCASPVCLFFPVIAVPTIAFVNQWRPKSNLMKVLSTTAPWVFPSAFAWSPKFTFEQYGSVAV